MKYGLISDLHLEHYRDPFVVDTILNDCLQGQTGYDTLIIAGDLHPFIEKRNEFFNRIKTNYIFVYGNHDYYGDFFPNLGDHIIVDDNFFACTLWTNFNNDPTVKYHATRSINDFYYIKGCTGDDMEMKFNKEWEMLNKEKKELLITHFGCFSGSIAKQYKGDLLNPYFITTMEDKIEYQPKVYVHGHTHAPSDYVYNGTRVICNPLGYPNENFRNVKDYKVKIFDL